MQGLVKLKVVPREDSATGALCCADISPDQSDSLAMAELLENGQSEATPDAAETALESGVAAQVRLRTVAPDNTSVLVRYSSHKVPKTGQFTNYAHYPSGDHTRNKTRIEADSSPRSIVRRRNLRSIRNLPFDTSRYWRYIRRLPHDLFPPEVLITC